MTVSELIEELKKLPQDSDVHLDAHFMFAKNALCRCSLAIPLTQFYAFNGLVFLSGDYKIDLTRGDDE